MMNSKTKDTIKSEPDVIYRAAPTKQASHEEAILKEAAEILKGRMMRKTDAIKSVEDITDYLTAHIAHLEHETFGVVMLDNSNRVIDAVELFRGTIDAASVYPREVVKEALSFNAAAVFLYHNHPSGNPKPSEADQRITDRIRQALELLDIRVLDHFIIAGTSVTCFASLELT